MTSSLSHIPSIDTPQFQSYDSKLDPLSSQCLRRGQIPEARTRDGTQAVRSSITMHQAAFIQQDPAKLENIVGHLTIRSEQRARLVLSQL